MATSEQSADPVHLERELVERCRAGERDAWSRLFALHHDFVRRAARRLGTPEAELDDVVQEAFTVAFRQLPGFSGGRMSTWLFRIASNAVSNRHRRRRVREAFLGMLGRQPPREAPSAERQWEAREAQEAVGKVLARMTPKKREVFALFELEGLSGEEISERVGCPVPTVWTRLHHARAEFQRLARQQGVVP